MNAQLVTDDRVSMLRIAREETTSVPTDVATGIAVHFVSDLQITSMLIRSRNQ